MPAPNSLTFNSSPKIGLVPDNRELRGNEIPQKRASSRTIGIGSFGIFFQLWANQVDLLEEALLHLPLGCERASSPLDSAQYSLFRTADADYRLDRDGRQLFKCGDLVDFLEAFRSVIALDVAERSPTRTFVHAGVVAWGDHAILIPGRSFTGKTTLVAELVRAGATYYSDEFAVVDKQGLVHPYAQPLQMRENDSHRQTQRPVHEFGGVAGEKPLPVGLVVVTKYKPEARWRPRQLTPGVGLLRLLDNTVSARRAPAAVLSTLKHVVSDAVIVRGARGEASEIVQWIAAHFPSLHKAAETTE